MLGVLGATLIVAPSFGQTNHSISLGSNLGTLNYSETTSTVRCNGDPQPFSSFEFSNFVYVSAQNVSQSIPDTADSNNLPTRFLGQGDCPTTQSDALTFSTSSYTIVVTPGRNGGVQATISVPGYINPKYIVLGVTYAPPGPQSFVNYTNSKLVSNTSSVSSSFSTGHTVTVSTTISAGILGFANGSSTSVASNSYSQTSSTSSTLTVEKTNSISQQVAGPADPQVGLDHDFDVIWVWLNPVALFTLSNGGAVQWNGYGYSTLDQPAMDVVGVFAGCLNGHLSQTSCNSLYATAFARAWAAGEIWPTGQGPALTSTDLKNILGADPYGQCGSASPIGASACPSPDPTRYTLSLNQDIQYQQPPPGGQPFTIQDTESYSNTSSQGTGAMYTTTQVFAYEKSFSLFKGAFDLSLATEQTLTWENEVNTQVSSTTTSSAEASITGPTCNVVGSLCSPAYPPSSPLYGQAIGFTVYQDNLFGTFLLVPSTY
jgi:hypothetical protein